MFFLAPDPQDISSHHSENISSASCRTTLQGWVLPDCVVCLELSPYFKWYINDISSSSSHQDGGYILFRFRAEGPENVVGMTRSGLLSVIIITVSHHFKCHIHFFFSFSSAFCKGRPPQKKCGFFQTFHPPTPVLEIKESGDLVSCPTRWSLWYWYLNFYVDHLVGGWDPILASVGCSAGGWSGPF